MSLSRKERRRIHKVTGEELEALKEECIRLGANIGVNETLKITYRVMNEEFGYGDKRLDRLEKGILKKLGREINE